MYKNNKREIIGIIITTIILIILIITTNIGIEKFSKTENIINKLFIPIQNKYIYLKNKINKKDNNVLKNIEELTEENKNLKKENVKLEEKLRELEIIKTENVKLRDYLNMKEEYIQYSTVPADIINKDISNLSNIMIINVGTKDGVYENMAVVSKDGLVGHVISSTKNTSKIQPIIDVASNVSAIVSSSRDNVILKGMIINNNDNMIKVTYIPTKAYLEIEDIVETSGLGGIYPKGILIGNIKKIIETKNIVNKYAILETAVDFSKLETVLVITEK